MIQVCIAILIIVVLAQSVAYHVLWNLEFFLRNLAVIGALCLVGAEACDPEPQKGGILGKVGDNSVPFCVYGCVDVSVCVCVCVCVCVSLSGCILSPPPSSTYQHYNWAEGTL